MATKKKFSELTEAGKKRRLKEYEKAAQEKGVTRVFGRLACPPILKTLDNGDFNARIIFFVYNHETQESKRMEASAYIKKESKAYKAYIQSLKKGQSANIELKERKSEDGTRTYLNIYNIFAVEKKEKKEIAQEVAPVEEFAPIDETVFYQEAQAPEMEMFTEEELADLLPF